MTKNKLLKHDDSEIIKLVKKIERIFSHSDFIISCTPRGAGIFYQGVCRYGSLKPRGKLILADLNIIYCESALKNHSSVINKIILFPSLIYWLSTQQLNVSQMGLFREIRDEAESSHHYTGLSIYESYYVAFTKELLKR
jgi:hypothetical protein